LTIGSNVKHFATKSPKALFSVLHLRVDNKISQRQLATVPIHVSLFK